MKYKYFCLFRKKYILYANVDYQNSLYEPFRKIFQLNTLLRICCSSRFFKRVKLIFKGGITNNLNLGLV